MMDYLLSFQKDIPTIIDSWLGGEVESFLQTQHLTSRDLKHFVAHPGGKKCLKHMYQRCR